MDSIRDRPILATKRIYLNSSQATRQSKFQVNSSGASTNQSLIYDLTNANIQCNDDEVLTCSLVNFTCGNNFNKIGQRSQILELFFSGPGGLERYAMNYNTDANNTIYNGLSGAQLIEWLNGSLTTAFSVATNDTTFILRGSALGQQRLGLTQPLVGGNAGISLTIYGEDYPNVGNVFAGAVGTSRELMRLLGFDSTKSYTLQYTVVSGGATTIVNNTSNINLGTPTHFLICSNLVSNSFANTPSVKRNVLAQVPIRLERTSFDVTTDSYLYNVLYENNNLLYSGKSLSTKQITSLDLQVFQSDGNESDFSGSDYNIELQFSTISRFSNSGIVGY
tara:strand:- start:1838 stop:2842 length:1005 start_codon:yes stop_codon:yes gene_type:complete